MPALRIASAALTISAFALVGCTVQDSAPVAAPNSSVSSFAAPSPSSSPSAETLVYVNGCDRAKLYKPTKFTLDCSSTPSSLVDLKWSTWNGKEAVGTGTINGRFPMFMKAGKPVLASTVRVHLTSPHLGKAGLGFTKLRISVFDTDGSMAGWIETTLKPPAPPVPVSSQVPTLQPTTDTREPSTMPAPTPTKK